jgi:hypothetical protein
MKFLVTLIFSLFCIISQAQKTDILLLGTYHFGGNTSDNIKVTNDNILSNQKQNELNVLLNKLEKFNPEIIYIENEPNRQPYWDSIYLNYRNGNQINLDNELFQIAIKLASRLNLKKGVKCVDWHIKPANTFSEIEYENLFNKMDEYYSMNLNDKVEKQSIFEENAIKEIHNFNDSITKLTMIEVFRNISSMLDIDENNINIFWSQNNMIRNVNIYQNIIQDILINKPKRVLIIYGAGHIKALKDYFEVHPAVKIIQTNKILE